MKAILERRQDRRRGRGIDPPPPLPVPRGSSRQSRKQGQVSNPTITPAADATTTTASSPFLLLHIPLQGVKSCSSPPSSSSKAEQVEEQAVSSPPSTARPPPFTSPRLAQAKQKTRFAPDPDLIRAVEKHFEKQERRELYDSFEEKNERKSQEENSVNNTMLSTAASNRSKLQCVCRRKQCAGVTAVFTVLQDKRGCFVELPPTEIERTLKFLEQPMDDDSDGESQSFARDKKNHRDDAKDKDVTWQLRRAYLRNLLGNDDSPVVREIMDDLHGNYFVALHHFHPQVVTDSHVVESDERLAVVCRTIHESSWKSLYLNLKEEDKIPGGVSDNNDAATSASSSSSYFVVPNYPTGKAKDDAGRAFSRYRLQQHSSMNPSNRSIGGGSSSSHLPELLDVVVSREEGSSVPLARSVHVPHEGKKASPSRQQQRRQTSIGNLTATSDSTPLARSSGGGEKGIHAPSWSKLLYTPQDGAGDDDDDEEEETLPHDPTPHVVKAPAIPKVVGAEASPRAVVSNPDLKLLRAGSERDMASSIPESHKSKAARSASVPRGGWFRGRSPSRESRSKSRGKSITRIFSRQDRSRSASRGPSMMAIEIDADEIDYSSQPQNMVSSETVAAALTASNTSRRGRKQDPVASSTPTPVVTASAMSSAPSPAAATAAAKTPPRARSPLRALSPFRRSSRRDRLQKYQLQQPKPRASSMAPTNVGSSSRRSSSEAVAVTASVSAAAEVRVDRRRPSAAPAKTATRGRTSSSPRLVDLDATTPSTPGRHSASKQGHRYEGPIDLDESMARMAVAAAAKASNSPSTNQTDLVSANGPSSSPGNPGREKIAEVEQLIPRPLDRLTLRRIRRGLIRELSDGSLECDLDAIMEATSDDDASTVATMQSRTRKSPRNGGRGRRHRSSGVVADAVTVPSNRSREEATARETAAACADDLPAFVPVPAAPTSNDAESSGLDFARGAERQLSPPDLDDEIKAAATASSEVMDSSQGTTSLTKEESAEAPEVATTTEESLEPEDTPEQAGPETVKSREPKSDALMDALVVATLASVNLSDCANPSTPPALDSELTAEESTKPFEEEEDVPVATTPTNPFEDASEHSSASYSCNPFDDETSPESPTPRTVDVTDVASLAVPSASTNPFDDPPPSLSEASANTPSPKKKTIVSSPCSEVDATEATADSTDFDSSCDEMSPDSPAQSKSPRMNLFALTQIEEEVVKRYRLPEGLKPLIELSEKPSDRSEAMAVFATIEAKRKSWATSELRGFKEQWGCYKDSIPAMIRETEWVEDLLKTSFKSMEAYSSMMRAVAGDSLLDESDRIITDHKKRNKLATKRSKEVYNFSSEYSVMQPVLNMIVSAVGQLDESVPSLVSEVESMSELSVHLSSKGGDLAKAGDRIMLDLECMELKIQAAWAHLENVDRDLEGTEDHWLAEASYRNTVREACAFFKKHYTELMKVCDSIIALDEDRRSRTKEILLSFLPRRRRVFLRVLEATQPAIDSLEEGRLGRDEINTELDLVIEQMARLSLSKQKRSRSSILNRSLTTKLDLKVEIDLSTITASNHFSSSHVKELRAIEARTSSKADWQLSLAVMTHEGFLHILYCDLPESQLKEFMESKQRAEGFLSTKCEGRTPDISLPLCECRSNMSSKKEHIEITLDGQSPFQKMMKRKVFIRLGTPLETSRWFEAHDAFWGRQGEEASSVPRVSRV